jgi:sugar phosphate isomerase/epimerase
MKQVCTFVIVLSLTVGCAEKKPETTKEKTVSTATKAEPKTETNKPERYFRYAIPDWCNRLFGAKRDTAGLCEWGTELEVALDLVDYDQWEAVQKAHVGLSCVLPVMGQDDDGENYLPFVPGFNDLTHHDRVRGALNEALGKAAAASVPFILVFTGFDTGESRDVQFERIVAAYTDNSSGESLIAKAERLGIVFVIEMLNTKGDEETWKGHPGYLGNDTTELVSKVIRPIGSTHFGLAFDVYHVVMMDEDPLDVITQHHDVIKYVHVAGVLRADEGHHPQNRGELDLDGQVIDYPLVMAALAKILPKGTYVLLEYIPTYGTKEGVEQNLYSAIALCESEIK